MAKDDHIEKTTHVIAFLQRIDADPELETRCARTDLDGRLELAEQLGLSFAEADLRRAIRSWDYHGNWNRWQLSGRLSDEVDDLPPLSDDYPITQEDIAAYRRDGHIFLRDVASGEEIDAYRPVVTRMVSRFNTQLADRNGRPEERGYLQVVNMHIRSAAARRLVHGRRFAKIAADLLGVESVRVYIDQAFYKEPGGKISHWHQDHLYYPLDTDDLITMWLPLVDVTTDMGVVAYASGSHRAGYLGFKPDFDDAELLLPEFVSERGYTIWEPPGVAAGGAVFHDGWVIHGAYPNRSDRMREVMVVVYYPDGTRIVEPRTEFEKRAIEIMFPGASPGDPAVSPVNPVVYPDGD